MLKTSDIYDFLIDNELATEATLDLLGSVAGYNEETFNRAIYCLTGFHDIEQLFNCCRTEFVFNDHIIEEINGGLYEE